MFQNSKHVQISGSPRFIYNDNKLSLASESLDEGVRLLVARVVSGAMHNSGERFDAPTCHEETRIAIQEDILGWADELVDDSNELVTWLYGPAGAGKSAIAQTIAQKLHARGRLTASFFFSRASGSDGRGSETNLVATLAHQLSQNLPATQPYISAAVRKNPLVFDLALHDQVDALIVVPLIAASDASSGFERPRVIVVDGLDECRQEKDAQRRVVDALIAGLRRIPHHSHKLFITSRPEYNILSIFKNYEKDLVHRMELNDTWKPDDDIRTFLNSGFADIRRSHFYFQSNPAEKTWPTPNAIDTLVQRSSGQFIYASVVLKYIKSEENYSPVDRLEIILQVKNHDDQPYAELDALYEHIFSRIRDVERVLTTLSLDWMRSRSPEFPAFESPLHTFLSEFMGVHRNEYKFWLLPLASILIWKEESNEDYSRIGYLHASLLDFLLDQSRSNIFCINSSTIATGIVRRSIELFEDGTALKASAIRISPCLFQTESILQRPLLMPILIGIPAYYANILPNDQKLQISSLVANFNLVGTVLCKISLDFLNWLSVKGLASYLNWVLMMSDEENASDDLLRLVGQIQTWLVGQFRRLDSDNLDDAEEIDVWPFFTYEPHESVRRPSMKRLSEDLSSAQEICASSPDCHQLLRGAKHIRIQSHQTAVLCSLMPYLDFDRYHLLGRYAMTTERYRVALQRTAYYLLQLPKHTLAGLLNSSKSKEEVMESPVMHLISEVLPVFWTRSPQTADQFFLVALIYPVMLRVVEEPHRRATFPRISAYIQQGLKKFPFLKDWTSSEYIQAAAQVEDALVSSKIRTSLHELAEKMLILWPFEKELPYGKILQVFAAIDRRVGELGA